MVQHYYGTKRVTAWRETQDGRPGYTVKYAQGYVSWSPRDVFEEAYRPINALSFCHALVALKEGFKLARKHWNGSGMFIWLNAGSVDCTGDYQSHYSGVPAQFFEPGDAGTATRMPSINMHAADGSTVTGWLASQTDMLAEDWMIVE